MTSYANQSQIKDLRARALEMQRYRCAYCWCPLGLDTATLDHLVPLSFGGRTSYANTVAACDTCNQDRGTCGPLSFWEARECSRDLRLLVGD